jgi:hypothetical protein
MVFPPYLLFKPVPYDGVIVHSIKRVDDKVILEASFVKKKCVFNKLVVTGNAFGLNKILEWNSLDLDGSFRSKDIDRLAGEQYIKLEVDAPPGLYDYFTVKVRHLCHSQFVDTEFARFSEESSKFTVIDKNNNLRKDFEQSDKKIQ